jgi:DNA polymerase-3 subunit delta'
MTLFDAVVGQPDAVAQLVGAAAGDAGHAWLIVGPAGSGRSIAARAFTAALQCETRSGCGRCAPCREVMAGSHPDVTAVATEGLSLGVRAMRALAPMALSSPAVGRHRVIVLEDADRLTETAANVLLKPIEEPADATVFVLCAPSTEDVLPTIRSRCRLVTLRVPSPTAVADLLAAEGIDRDLATFAAAAGQGHVGRARRLARDVGARDRRAAVLQLPQELGSVASALAAAAQLLAAADEEAASMSGERDAAETAALKESLGVGVRGVTVRGTAGAVKELESEQRSRSTRARRDVLDRALVDLAALYRDALLLALRAGGEPVHADQTAVAAELAQAATPESLLRRIDAVLACREAIETNVAPLLAVEAMALGLRTD